VDGGLYVNAQSIKSEVLSVSSQRFMTLCRERIVKIEQ
jgi:hypothetical protein